MQTYKTFEKYIPKNEIVALALSDYFFFFCSFFFFLFFFISNAQIQIGILSWIGREGTT